MKTYILQKDLPGVKAGTEYELINTNYWPKGEYHFPIAVPQQLVESNPDFFKLKEEEVVTVNLLAGKTLITGGEKWELYLSKPISQAQWLAVKSAIEAVLNDAVPTNKVCPDCGDLGWVDDKHGGRSVCICHLT